MVNLKAITCFGNRKFSEFILSAHLLTHATFKGNPFISLSDLIYSTLSAKYNFVQPLLSTSRKGKVTDKYDLPKSTSRLCKKDLIVINI